LPKENTDSMMRNTIKVERAKKNLTQAELAERIGVSRQAVNSIETGKFIPSTLLALRMAKVFEVLVEQIFQIEDDEII
jgi:putative transcriptional regulator